MLTTGADDLTSASLNLLDLIPCLTVHYEAKNECQSTVNKTCASVKRWYKVILDLLNMVGLLAVHVY